MSAFGGKADITLPLAPGIADRRDRHHCLHADGSQIELASSSKIRLRPAPLHTGPSRHKRQRSLVGAESGEAQKMGARISSGTLRMAAVLPPAATTPSPAPVAIGAIVVAVDPRTVITAAPSPAPIPIGAIVIAVDPRTVIAPLPAVRFFDKSVSLPVNGLLG